MAVTKTSRSTRKLHNSMFYRTGVTDIIQEAWANDFQANAYMLRTCTVVADL